MSNLYLQYNTKFENFTDIPVRCLIFLLKKLHIFDLFQKYAQDGRTKEGTYSIASLLMVALQILLFRSPSKNHFYQNKKLKRPHFYKNLGALANVKDDQFPHSKTIDDAFWLLGDSSQFEPVLFDLFKKLRSSKLFYNHPSLKKNGSYYLAIDGVVTHTYHSDSQHPCKSCAYCLKRERKTEDGETKVWYLHMEVIASLIFENSFQMPIYCHRVKKRQEWNNLSVDDLKQECEITVLPLVLQKIRTYLPKIKIIVLLDGIYCNQTSLNILKQFHCGYCIVLKRLISVKKDFEGLKTQINEKVRSVVSKRFFIHQTTSFVNEIHYESHSLNVIEFDEYAQKKPTKRFAKVHQKNVHYQWIVDQKIEEASVFKLVEGGRYRWKGEDFFQTIKKRGFHIEHDYSRHPMSQGIWLYLTLIAFAITSIFLLSDFGILCRKQATIRALMEQMLQDLFYLSYELIFLSSYPKQLRFSLWMNAG